jgi:hypothetical protein
MYIKTADGKQHFKTRLILSSSSRKLPKLSALHAIHRFRMQFADSTCNLLLKGHGNEADFLGFFQKLVPYRSLTLPFEPFRFWLRIRGDIRNRKTTPHLAESANRFLNV